MGVLEFIFGILVLVVVFILGVGYICMKWDVNILKNDDDEDLNTKRTNKEDKNVK